MNEIIENENISNMIYEIRGLQVMLDYDLAKLYHCTNGTKDINKAVKRNKNRFPNDFYFQLTEEETKKLWFQTGTANMMSRTNPHVFTEQGVAMLASVLHTAIAEDVSIKIMRSFVMMGKYFSNNLDNSEILINHENRIIKLENIFDKMQEKQIKSKILYEGQLYDSYSILLDILNLARKEIIIIDNYAGKELLDILKNINQKILIVSKNIDETLKNKYESQYNNVLFMNNNSFHDRFIIIDRKIVYTCGASFKDLGKKCFYIGEINNNYIEELLLTLTKN